MTARSTPPTSAQSPELTCDRRTLLQQSLFAVLAAGFVPANISLAGAEQESPPQNDVRLGKLPTLNDDFPFVVPPTLDVWKHRAQELRRQIQLATGLWPMPARLPIQATIHGKVERNDCAVERVFFESSPGLFVTGSLFRPLKTSDNMPIVLCPHGHWPNGRFYSHSQTQIAEELRSGGEKHANGGRFPIQARCFQLARMGCVVFNYDMLGYADSVPISQEVAHLFRKQRPTLSQPDRWGLFSAQAESRLLSPLGLQTFHSVRALDFLLTLRGVDTSRVGVTGSSGGGTQTFLLMAVDDRPTAGFPAVMVSTKMQGGCTCENASYLRIATGNIELAALAAPRPLGMSAADDWTKELETLGLPELKKLYGLFDASDRVEGKYFPFPHNYNYPSRAMMYEFFNKHLSLGQTSPIVEPDFEPLSKDELTVWTDQYPKPEISDDAEVAVLKALASASDQQMEEYKPTSSERMHAFRETVGGAWASMIGRALPGAEEINFRVATKATGEGTTLIHGSIDFAARQESSPATVIHQDGPLPRTVIVWISPEGRSAVEENGSPRPVIRQMVSRGLGVIGVDLLYQGTHGNRAGSRSRAIENDREAACFVLGYSSPLFAQRVHDVLSAIAYARQWVGPEGTIRLAGAPGAAGWIAAAAFVAGPAIERVALATDGFRFNQITDIEDPNLLPGAVKYGDLPALLALLAPVPLWIHGESEAADELPAIMYQTSQVPTKLDFDESSSTGVLERMAQWLAAE
ncbi:hypothetical protein K2X85_13450 [bacterium]|nr:hypothetical protein [bacterium]